MHTTYPKPQRATAEQRIARRQARLNARAAARLGRARAADDTKIDYELLALKKGPTSDERKADEHRAEAKQIQKTRAKVWKRTSRCEFCGDNEQETAEKHWLSVHHMHEQPSRAETRGLPPEQRFNVAICCRICDPCHQLATDNVLRAAFHDEAKGFTGDFDIIAKATGQIVRVMRRGLEDRPRLAEESEVTA